jgi:hypothetical protein
MTKPGITPTSAKTAPLPWRYLSYEVDEIRDADGGRVCMMHQLKGDHGLAGRRDSGEVEGSAKLIVEAVNYHASLVSRVTELEKALREIVKRCSRTLPTSEELNIAKLAKAALKARSESVLSSEGEAKGKQ